VVSYQPLRFGEVSLHLAFRGEKSLCDGLRFLKPSHKGSPPQTVVRGGTCVNRRG
jgi:hypothetical protein